MIIKFVEVLIVDLKWYFSLSCFMKSYEVDFLCLYVLFEIEKRKKKVKKKKRKRLFGLFWVLWW